MSEKAPARRNAAGEERRRELLDRIIDHVLERGVANLTLRGLAQAVGSNNRMLIYYFGGFEQLLTTALDESWNRFPTPTDPTELLADRTTPLTARLEQLWQLLAEPARHDYMRLFFGVLGIAAYDRERYASFLEATKRLWIQPLTDAIAAEGVDMKEAELLAYEAMAQWRGLEALQLASQDYELVDRVRLRWVHSLTERIHLTARIRLADANERTQP
ncbi:TetR/AcrR family transcriptional regulator [Streptomyces sp. NPDC047042]|uniref:TetR/AcrR family transcriptional regulator n=1 Tax=Streptomyces sp. NPDC047042 TaxID=3154807 RepID=UPI003401EC7C